MRNIIVLYTIYWKSFFKNRKSAAILWLTPIFFLFGIGLIVHQWLAEESHVQPFKLAIVNEDDTVETELVIKQLTESEHLTKLLKTMDCDRDTAKRYMEENQVAAVIFIPKGFSKDIAKGKNTPVTVAGNPQQPLQAQLIRHVMESAAEFTSAAQSSINTVSFFMAESGFSKQEQKDQFKRNIVLYALHVLGRGEIFTEVNQENLFQQRVLAYYLVSFSVILLMIWSFMALLLFKANGNKRMEERFAVFGVSRIQSLSARMLASFSLVFLSVSILAAIGVFFQEWDWQEVGVYIVMTALMIFLFLSVFVFLESFFKRERMILLASILFILFNVIVGEHFIPVVYYPEWLQQLNLISLNGWVLKGIFTLLQEHPVYSIGTIGVLLLLFSFFCIGGAAIMLRIGRGSEHC